MTRRVVAADVMSPAVAVVHGGETVGGAWHLLLRTGQRHVVVVEHGRCAGVVDDRVVAMSRADVSAPVRDLLPLRTACVLPSADLAEVAGVLLGSPTDAVPVVDPDGGVLGVVTARDVLQVVADRGVGAPAVIDLTTGRGPAVRSATGWPTAPDQPGAPRA